MTGHHLAWRVRGALLPTVEAYGPTLLKDILPAFSNLEKRADEVAEKEFERLGALPAGEDCDGDMADAAEAAQDEGLTFYETMLAMRQATLNLFSVGLFHLVEQQLVMLCDDASFPMKPPDTRLDLIATWYRRHLRLDLRQLPNSATVDELRLLANAVKHGEGSTEKQKRERQQLREQRPELFEDPFTKKFFSRLRRIEKPLRQPLAGDDIYVTEEIFAEYAAAAVGFFEALIAYFEEHGKDHYPDA